MEVVISGKMQEDERATPHGDGTSQYLDLGLPSLQDVSSMYKEDLMNLRLPPIH